MDRRTFLKLLGGTGVILLAPSVASPALDDEAPLSTRGTWSVGILGGNYVIPVVVEQRRVGAPLSRLLEVCERLIDRPVFGMAPESLRLTSLNIDDTGTVSALLLLDGSGSKHTIQMLDADSLTVDTFRFYQSDSCRDLRFSGRNFTATESDWLHRSHLAAMDERAAQMAGLDAVLAGR